MSEQKLVEKFERVLKSDFKRIEGISIVSEFIQGPGITYVELKENDTLNVKYIPIKYIPDKQLVEHMQKKVSAKDLKKYMFVLFVMKNQPMTLRVKKTLRVIKMADDGKRKVDVIKLGDD